MSKYVFANPAHTLVKRLDDGATFELPRHTHPSNIHGHAAEEWRRQGCPTPAPYAETVKPSVVPDDYARRARRSASDDRRRT